MIKTLFLKIAILFLIIIAYPVHPVLADTGNIRIISGDLEAFINNISIPNTGFVTPDNDDLAVWKRIIGLVSHGNYQEAALLAEAQNYEAINFRHTDNNTYFVLKEKTEHFRGLGTYVFNPSPKRSLVLEVPHPVNDRKTREQGIKAFIQLQAYTLMIAGTYRCSSCQASPFEGTTTVCNSPCSLPTGSNPYRISDVAHYKFNFFHETHETLYDLYPRYFYIQLHGATDRSLGIDSDNKQVDVILTLGKNEVPEAGSLILKLDQELDNRDQNSRIYGLDTTKLGGSTNVQGRYTNGHSVESYNTCQDKGYFIHIEQDYKLRENPQLMIDALAETFPEHR